MGNSCGHVGGGGEGGPGSLRCKYSLATNFLPKIPPTWRLHAPVTYSCGKVFTTYFIQFQLFTGQKIESFIDAVTGKRESVSINVLRKRRQKVRTVLHL
jgi:hypothetical protein